MSGTVISRKVSPSLEEGSEKPLLYAEAGGVSVQPRGISVGWCLSAAAHLMILAALLWLHARQPLPDPTPSVLVDLVDLSESPPPGPPDVPASAGTAESAVQPVVIQPVALQPITIQPIPQYPIEMTPVAAASPVPDTSDLLSDSQLVGAAGVEGESGGSGGGIVLAKMTLGEMGGGDTYGTLFGETHNPYDLARTVGGSSGGPGAGITANFGTVAIGEEGFASIRRPSAWNSIVGMRPSPGLVGRAGMWDGYPTPVGQLGPMAKTVTDLATLLDVMVGYDAEDPVSALGRGHIPPSYTKFLDKDGLKGARIGVLHAAMGLQSEPASDDFKRVTVLFDKAVEELRTAGATTIDIEIPGLNEALATRITNPADDAASVYFARNPNSPFKSMKDLQALPDYNNSIRAKRAAYQAARRPASPPSGTPESRYAAYVTARDRLNVAIMKIMADNNLDAIVHKTVEHTPTLIKDGIAPPYVGEKGAPHLNTFLVYAASMTVPAGFTDDGLPVGITFFGPAYSEPTMIRLAYSYEQATHHRIPPKTTPPLPAK